MFYYRSTKPDRMISRNAARMATTTALLAYPAGALLLALGSDTAVTKIAGYGLICVTLLMCCAIFRTQLQRIVAEEAGKLDEFELVLRAKAMWGAYAAFSLLALLAVLYAGIATDGHLWVPSTYEEFNGLFWGVLAYGLLLPGTSLAWLADPSDLVSED